MQDVSKFPTFGPGQHSGPDAQHMGIGRDMRLGIVLKLLCLFGMREMVAADRNAFFLTHIALGIMRSIAGKEQQRADFRLQLHMIAACNGIQHEHDRTAVFRVVAIIDPG